MNTIDYAANLAFFLQDQTGSILGEWRGRMPAKAQRALFGEFLGRGELVINGDNETVKHMVWTCFGDLQECTQRRTWAELAR